MMLLIAVRVVGGMFAVGLVGSGVVLVLTAIEDVQTLFGGGKD